MGEMKAFLKRESVYINLILMVFFAVFARFWEPGLGNSATGYGSLARNLSEDWNWFHLHLAPHFFNPFVDHPPLIIWLDALVFKLFGASAQTIRLLSSIAALGIFSALFFTVRRYFDERAALFSVFSLITVNVFMNYTSSGWLDMPMIGLVWAGTYFGFRGLQENKERLLFLAGVSLGFSVLAKGVCALALFPVAFFIGIKRLEKREYFSFFMFNFSILMPVLLFTWGHYNSAHFLFWIKYWQREALEQTLNNPQSLSILDYLWYVKKAFQFGHLVTILGLVSCVTLWRFEKRDWALLVLSEFLIHSLGYSWSTRHYSQYVIPIFPWLALGSGILLAKGFKKFQTLTISKVGLALGILFFTVVDIFPIRVHSGNENPFRGLMSTMRQIKDNKNMYFVGSMEDQSTWEDPASYIVWYAGRNPIIGSFDEILENLGRRDPQALAVISTGYLSKNAAALSRYPNVTKCIFNDQITILSQTSLCPDEVKSWRYREEPKSTYEKAP